MATTMAFPRTQPQAASIYTQQATTQQSTGIDISTLLMNLMPLMIIGMMAKMASSLLGKKKQVQAATTESTTSRSKA